MSRPAPPTLPPSSAPVLAILVCHNGAGWLPATLSALRDSTTRPAHVFAVDTGSGDDTPRLLAEAATATGEHAALLDGVLTLPRDTGFAAAVAAAVAEADERLRDEGWIWLLHDDCAPEPDCLAELLAAAKAAPSAGILGALALDWHDPRLIVEGGLSTDASGHRQPAELIPHRAGRGADEPDGPESGCERATEVLAVPSAGALIQRNLWDRLGGFDPAYGLMADDIDFGWRAGSAGRLVLSVPGAHVRHARASTLGQRRAHALEGSVPAADRAHGLRTFLINCGRTSFLLGLVRLVVLSTLRGAGFAVLGRSTRGQAEFAAIGYLLGGRARLRAARRARPGGSGSPRALLTSRLTRLRRTLRAGVVRCVRRKVAADAVLARRGIGRAPQVATNATAWMPPELLRTRARRTDSVSPDALSAGALTGSSARPPGGTIAVALRDELLDQLLDELPNDPPASAEPTVAFVGLTRRRVLAATVLAPPVLLVIGLTAVALAMARGRLGLDLAGGKLLPVGELGQQWSTYLAHWHPISGGATSSAPAALAVLGAVGAVFAPVGGPATFISLVLLADAPLAALSTYVATRRVPVHRWIRAAIAAAYGLLPVATAALAQGRLHLVAAHILLPLVCAAIAGVLTKGGTGWLHHSVLCAFGLALLGAFSPLTHLMALVGLLVGFVVLPPVGDWARRIGSLLIVVVLPLALLLPWTISVVDNPGLLWHGLGAPTRDAPLASMVELFGLDPGGPGAWPVGLAVVVAALVALIVKPSRRAGVGLAVTALGAAGVVVLRLVSVRPVQGGDPVTGYPGTPLLVVSMGLLAVVLAAGMPTSAGGHARPTVLLPRLAAGGASVVVLVLAAAAVLAGAAGPLRTDGHARLVASHAAQLAEHGRSVLVLDGADEPVRQVGGRQPRFGDDTFAAVPGTDARLAGWQRDILRGSPEATRASLASVAAAGTLFVVLPAGADGDRVARVAGDLVAPAEPTSDGRAVLRLTPPGGQAVLISPLLAQRAVHGQPPQFPAPATSTASVAPVPAELPDANVRVSDGAPGRLLVLAAAMEPGWRASVDGDQVPIVRAWGHQVAVAVPTQQAEVSVRQPSTAHNVLLLGQVAALLFTILTVIPGRAQPPSRTRP